MQSIGIKVIQIWEGKAILWELHKGLKFYHTDKWYKPKSVLKNKAHKILQDFAIQTEHQILVWWPDPVLITKK